MHVHVRACVWVGGGRDKGGQYAHVCDYMGVWVRLHNILLDYIFSSIK